MNTLRVLFRARLLRGVLEGSRGWVVIGVLVAARRLARRQGARVPEVVFCEELPRGEAFVISHRARPNRRAAEPR